MKFLAVLVVVHYGTHTCVCTLPVQCIFPLQPVRGNYPRVHTALNELRSIAREVFVGTNSRGCVLDGLQEALGQFHRVVQSSKPV